MMDARAFYTSAAWIKCRTGYMQSQHYVCERCGGIGEICRHKTYITPENIHDPYITLNWDNLECVCQHAIMWNIILHRLPEMDCSLIVMVIYRKCDTPIYKK